MPSHDPAQMAAAQPQLDDMTQTLRLWFELATHDLRQLRKDLQIGINEARRPWTAGGSIDEFTVVGADIRVSTGSFEPQNRFES